MGVFRLVAGIALVVGALAFILVAALWLRYAIKDVRARFRSRSGAGNGQAPKVERASGARELPGLGGGTTMSARLIGVLLFLLAAAIAVVYALFGSTSGNDPLVNVVRGLQPEQVEVMGFVGGEKRSFVDNPQVREILQDRYGLTVDQRKAGSIEMVTSQALLDQKPDFLWPSETSLAIARERGLAIKKDEIVFNSPIVLYSWLPVAAALERQGIARPLSDARATFAVDTAKLLDLIMAETAWSDIGVDSLYGSVMAFSTDPNKSNSGNQFASLVVQVRGAATDEAQALEDVATLYKRMGYAVGSSSDIFEQYLRQGMGALPIVAGYENQLIEFARVNPEIWQDISGKTLRPVVLYPEPTMFSSHTIIALTEAGETMAEALRDKDLQDIAWAQHGFRSGFAPSNDPSVHAVEGIPATVSKVVPLPKLRTIEDMQQVVKGSIVQ